MRGKLNVSLNLSIGHFFLYQNNIDSMVDRFYSIMNKFLDELCPYHEITSKHEPVPWMNVYY